MIAAFPDAVERTLILEDDVATGVAVHSATKTAKISEIKIILLFAAFPDCRWIGLNLG